MSEVSSIILLLSVPGLPLLLAFPAVRIRLPRPCHIALLPAISIFVFPVIVSTELPWLLFDARLSIDGVSRWLLAMTVTVWAVAATLLRTNTSQPPDNYLTTFFLMTMAGNLGVILAADLVGFFVFSTLMGYALYGLMVFGTGKQARRAGRFYLVILILADLLLFDALLIAAATTEYLGFEAVRGAMAESPSAKVYLALVLVGFALKAGVWPLHFWLPPAFNSARPAVALLLGVGPVATGLLGALHWLPLGEITEPKLGTLLQYLGVAAMLYAALFGLMRVQCKGVPAYVTVFATGAFTTGLGSGMVDPAVWNQYRGSAFLFVALMGLGLAIMAAGNEWLEANRSHPSEPKASGEKVVWFDRWSEAVFRWGQRIGVDTLPGLRALWLARWGGFWQTRAWQRMFDVGEHYLQHWTFAATVFLLLGMVFAVLLLLDVIAAM